MGNVLSKEKNAYLNTPILHKGNIFDDDGVKYFGVLNGLSIAVCLNSNNIHNIPYDCINTLIRH